MIELSDTQSELSEAESDLSDVNTTLHELPTEWTLYDLESLNSTVLGFDDELATILAYLDAINGSLTDLDIDISNVNSTLSEKLAFYENQSQWIPQPSFDSGWIDITNNTGGYITIMHDLNTTDSYVEITGKTSVDGGIHQHNLGGTYDSGWMQVYSSNQQESAWTVV